MDPEKSDENSQINVTVEESRPKLKEPPNYAVILHNDDYTTMEFVVDVLQKYFKKTNEEAAQIMLLVHRLGKGVAGVFQIQIAETKVVQVHNYARSRGFPLKCSIELVSSD
jgi:ATP-dependent Clp protease adaptor protein ClpS